MSRFISSLPRLRPLGLLLVAGLALPSLAEAGKKDKIKKSKKKKPKQEQVEVVEEAPAEEAPAPERAPLPRPDWAADSPASGEILVRLVDPGAAPHEELRLAHQPGDVEVMVMTMDMAMGMTMMGMDVPAMDIPTQIYTFDVQVTEVDGDGNSHSHMVLTDVRMEGEDPMGLAMQLQPLLQSMVGFGGTTVTSPRGLVVSSDFEIPEGMPADAAQQMESLEQQSDTLAVPFPEEPVGIGGTWEVFRSRDQQGITMLERLQVTLVERDGTDIVLETKTDLALGSEASQMQGLPPGAKVHFTEFSSGGSGRSVIALDRAVPIEGTAHMDLRMAMDIEVDGGTQGMAMDMSMDFGVHGGGDAAD